VWPEAALAAGDRATAHPIRAAANDGAMAAFMASLFLVAGWPDSAVSQGLRTKHVDVTTADGQSAWVLAGIRSFQLVVRRRFDSVEVSPKVGCHGRYSGRSVQQPYVRRLDENVHVNSRTFH
jgi:hypothetical protein